MSRAAVSPPLWAMPAAVIAGTLLILALAGLQTRHIHLTGEVYADYTRQRLADTVPVDRTAPRPFTVVAIGRSLLHHATPEDAAMQAWALERRGLAMQYVRIQTPTTEAGRAWPSILDDVLAADPDIVIFERDWFYCRRSPHIISLARLRDLALSRLRSICHGGPWWPSQARLAAEIAPWENYRVKRTHMSTDRLQEIVRRRAQEECGRRPGTEALLRRFAQLGTTVVILDIPVHPRAEVTRDLERRQKMRAIDADLRERALARTWRCPASFEDKDFLDLRHMSLSGRETHTNWLVDKLADLARP